MATRIGKPESAHETRVRLGLLSIREAAARLGVTYQILWRHSKADCPAPSAQFGDGPRLYYQEADLERLRRYCESIGLIGKE